MCEQCQVTKASLRVTLADNTQKLMCKDCAAEQQRIAQAEAAKAAPAAASAAPTRAAIKRMPNFVAAQTVSSSSSSSSSLAKAAATMSRAPVGGVSRSSTMARIAAPKASALASFGTSSLRIGKKKAAGDTTSVRNKRHVDVSLVHCWSRVEP